MKQNRFEFMLENNPARRLVKEHMEVKPLSGRRNLGEIGRALEIGCGTGNGTNLLMKYYAPGKISAVDRYEDLIAIARKKNRSAAIDFSVQDICALDFPDESFNAVFDLADLHNIRDWIGALSELKRVLKPGGFLVTEEISIETFTHGFGRLFRLFTEHPYDSMFTMKTFREHVLGIGFEILHYEERNPAGLLKYCFLIARKKPD